MIGEFKNPAALVAYRIGVTVAQLRLMLLVGHNGAYFCNGYRLRTVDALQRRGIVEGSSPCRLTPTGADLIAKAGRIALDAVLTW